MSDAYIERCDDAYMVAGTRVSLEFTVYAFLSGQSAEAIAQALPVLGLEQLYGAITYDLAHRDDIDGYLASRRHDFAAARQAARDTDPMFSQKLAEPGSALRSRAECQSAFSRRGSETDHRVRRPEARPARAPPLHDSDA